MNHKGNAEEIAAQARQFFGSQKRPPRREQYSKHYWETWSPRLGRNVGIYGDRRFDHWVLVETEPKIVWYTERPARFRLQIGRYTVFCTFDMVVQWRDNSIECRRILNKPLTASCPSDRRDAIEAEREWCKANGYRYLLLTNADIEQHEQLIHNWRSMLPSLSRALPGCEEQILRVVAMAGECNVSDLEEFVSDDKRDEYLASLYHLLHTGLLVSPNLCQSSIWSVITVRINHE